MNLILNYEPEKSEETINILKKSKLLTNVNPIFPGYSTTSPKQNISMIQILSECPIDYISLNPTFQFSIHHYQEIKEVLNKLKTIKAVYGINMFTSYFELRNHENVIDEFINEMYSNFIIEFLSLNELQKKVHSKNIIPSYIEDREFQAKTFTYISLRK